MFLLDDLLLLPFRGLLGILKEIQRLAEQETSDRARLHEKLLYAQLQFELDEITEAEYQQREEEILQRLQLLEEVER
ncbi:MAG: gas vesicle protein GvpG [Candidatus Tectomicrobia bacterium]|nr:gas vesicle protein GvpG [Candidatus Tectomicrobia bacterium]